MLLVYIQTADSQQVQTSCGYAVPYLALKADPTDSKKQIPHLEDRQTLGHWGQKQVSIVKAPRNCSHVDYTGLEWCHG
jgi:hypothetical protein